MENSVYQEVELKKIVRNPLNPRKRFEGPKFDELVASVKAKGVIEPILLRPINGKKEMEIVAGERRYRASCVVANENGGLDSQTIPSMVRELSDDDAFDIMCIENLHREDLTELEEAESFKAYINRHGEGALAELAEKIGINPRYIRRRVAVLDLPKQVLKAWEKGELKYGHLEQLRRLDKKEIQTHTQEIIRHRGAYSVRALKDDIDRQAINLKDAKFDLEKAGCLGCMKNTEVQKDLFDMGDLKGAHCLDPKCFKQNQNNWLLKNWKKTGYRKQHGTNGFRFYDDVSWSEFERFYSKPPKRCKECPDLVTLIYLDGRVSEGKVCLGEKSCFNKKAAASKESGSETEKKEPRKTPDWHGEYFREEFYKEQLPIRLQAVPVDDVVAVRVMLFSLLKLNNNLHEWWGVKRGLKQPRKDGDYWSTRLRWEEIWETISTMDYDRAREDLQEASIQTVMQDQYAAKCRRMIADHIGISLAKEWRITDEYLNKKTVPEIHAIAKKFKLFETKEAKTFLFEKLLKKRGNFKSCKKGELKRLFLESGVDLAGVVPEEILSA